MTRDASIVMMKTLDFCFYCVDDEPWGEAGELMYNEVKECFFCTKCGRIFSLFDNGFVGYKITAVSEFYDLLICLKADLMNLGIDCYYVLGDGVEYIYLRVKRFSFRRIGLYLLLRKSRKWSLLEKIGDDE